MKTQRLNIRVDNYTKKQLAVAAAISGYSQSQIVCVAVDQYVERRRQLKEKVQKALTDHNNDE